MKKEVYITLKSAQTVDNSTDTTELFTVGTFERTEEGYRLFYDETEATGFAGSSVTLNISDTSVTMMRTGTAISTLIIEKGEKHHCHYGTEYGDFMIGISTDEVKNNVSDDGGNLYLKYTLDINSSLMSVNEMFINIKERNNDE